jgi:addiction module RelE/StbE family toxin
MKRELLWTRRALARLDQIGTYIAKHDPAAAGRVVHRLSSMAATLQTRPLIGREGRVSGTREMVLSDIAYIIAYRVTETKLEILTILHTSQRWPDKI